MHCEKCVIQSSSSASFFRATARIRRFPRNANCYTIKLNFVLHFSLDMIYGFICRRKKPLWKQLDWACSRMILWYTRTLSDWMLLVEVFHLLYYKATCFWDASWHLLQDNVVMNLAYVSASMSTWRFMQSCNYIQHSYIKSWRTEDEVLEYIAKCRQHW